MITGLYAALLGLMFLGLSYYVINGRKQYQVSLGDGGNEELTTRIRIQGNFAENVPLALVLIMLVEMQGAPLLSLHAMGLVLIVGRIGHIAGLRWPSLRWRVVGMVLTHVVILTSAVFLIWKFLGQAI